MSLQPKPTKNCHYIPRMYLLGFTPNHCKDDKIWALDQQKARQFEVFLENVAFEKRLYWLDNSEYEVDFIEQKVFGNIERETTQIIQTISRYNSLPVGEDYETLMSFFALMFVRTPKFKEMLNNHFDSTSKQFLKMSISNEQQFCGKKKYNNKSKIDNETLRKLIQEEKFKLELTQNAYMVSLLGLWAEVIPYFTARKWVLYSAENKDIFITSDNPVWLAWTNPLKSSTLYRPGIGVTETEVTFPLTNKLALVGTFEQDNALKTASSRTVAVINSRTAMGAKRFLFSSHKTFHWLQNDNKVCKTIDLLSSKHREMLNRQSK